VAADEQRSAAENLFDDAECLLHPLVRPPAGKRGILDPRPRSLDRRASERTASPVAHPSLPRQRRHASCHLVNAMVNH